MSQETHASIMDPLYVQLGALGLLAIAGLLLWKAHSLIEDRACKLEQDLAQLRDRTNAVETAVEQAQVSAERAHVRIDNHQKQIEALGHDIGWSDNRARTRILTGTQIPAAAFPSIPPALPKDETP